VYNARQKYVEIQRFQHYLNTPGNSVLTLHQRPDGDSIGSNLALKNILEEHGHTVQVFSADAVPESFSFLKGVDEITVQTPTENQFVGFEYYFALDMGDQKMIGADTITFPADLPVVVIDHHDTNEDWGTDNFVDRQAVSAASVVFEIAQELEIPISEDTATKLLTGLMTDTGFFKFPRGPEVIKMFSQTAELIRLGGVYGTVLDNLSGKIPPEDLTFIGESLRGLTIDPEHRIAFFPIPNHTWKSVGVSLDKIIYVKEYASQVDGTDIGAVLIEEEPGRIKISLRANADGVDVTQIAEKLHGGGHKKAAGATLHDMTLEEAQQAIIDSL